MTVTAWPRMDGGEKFRLTVVADRYFVVEGHGFLDFEHSRRVQAELDLLAELHPNIDQVLYDGTDTDGFEPGLAIQWIRWAAARRRPSRRVAIVTRTTTVVAVSSTFRFMLPRLRFAVFNNRDAAIAFLNSENDPGPRTRR